MKKRTPKVARSRLPSGSSWKNGTPSKETTAAATAVEQDSFGGSTSNAWNRQGAQKGPASAERQITLRLHNPSAQRVFAAGTFNNWHGESSPLKSVGNGEWVLALGLIPGTYEYRFIVDGQWCDDPLAAERARNPYGGYNAVLKVDSRVILLPDHLP